MSKITQENSDGNDCLCSVPQPLFNHPSSPGLSCFLPYPKIPGWHESTDNKVLNTERKRKRKRKRKGEGRKISVRGRKWEIHVFISQDDSKIKHGGKGVGDENSIPSRSVTFQQPSIQASPSPFLFSVVYNLLIKVIPINPLSPCFHYNIYEDHIRK